jgi:hypothetical protein
MLIQGWSRSRKRVERVTFASVFSKIHIPISILQLAIIGMLDEHSDAGNLIFSGVFRKLEQGMALTSLEGYVNGAIFQRRRIKSHESRMDGVIEGKNPMEERTCYPKEPLLARY